MVAQSTVDGLLEQAAELLNTAAAGERPARFASDAIQLVLAIGSHPDVRSASKPALDRVSAAFDAAVSAVVEDTSSDFAPVSVSFGMGVAGSLLHFYGPGVDDLARGDYRLSEVSDRFDHAALLAAELDALMIRRRIEARGNHFALSAAMRLGMSGDIPDAVQFH